MSKKYLTKFDPSLKITLGRYEVLINRYLDELNKLEESMDTSDIRKAESKEGDLRRILSEYEDLRGIYEISRIASAVEKLVSRMESLNKNLEKGYGESNHSK